MRPRRPGPARPVYYTLYTSRLLSDVVDVVSAYGAARRTCACSWSKWGSAPACPLSPHQRTFRPLSINGATAIETHAGWILIWMASKLAIRRRPSIHRRRVESTSLSPIICFNKLTVDVFGYIMRHFWLFLMFFRFFCSSSSSSSLFVKILDNKAQNALTVAQQINKTY